LLKKERGFVENLLNEDIPHDVARKKYYLSIYSFLQ
jgi:hypothetical protein